MHAVGPLSMAAKESNYLFSRKLLQHCIPTVPFDCSLLSIFVLLCSPNSIVYLGKIYIVSMMK